MSKLVLKACLIIAILFLPACGFRQHEQRMIAEYQVQTAIMMNTPACNPDLVDCGLITGEF